jgi:thiamine-phosphate pyrophosphorylase
MSPICPSMLSWSRLPIPRGRLTFDLSLYLVANRPSFQDETLFFLKIMSAVKGGVSCVQFRDHKNNLSETIRIALILKKMLKGVPLFINTLQSFDVVHAVDAEGIYLEDNFPHFEARKLLGRKAVIGTSVKTMEEVLALKQESELDYVSIKVSPSKKTCPRNDQLWGIEGLRHVRALIPHRIVAIGGLNLSSVEPIYRELRSDDGIAMAGGLMDEEAPNITAQKIQSIRQKIREEK